MPDQDGIGWHTPQELSGVVVCRSFLLPIELWPAVNDQLDQLTLPENWYPAGIDADEMAEAAQAVWRENICMIGMIAAFSIGNLSVMESNGWLIMKGGTFLAEDFPELHDHLPNDWKTGTDFTLPNMDTRTIVGAAGGQFTWRNMAGSANHTLSIDEIPAHTHTYERSVVSDIDLELTGAPQPVYNAPVTSNTGSAGGGEAHNNMPPFIALGWYIFAGRSSA